MISQQLYQSGRRLLESVTGRIEDDVKAAKLKGKSKSFSTTFLRSLSLTSASSFFSTIWTTRVLRVPGQPVSRALIQSRRGSFLLRRKGNNSGLRNQTRGGFDPKALVPGEALIWGITIEKHLINGLPMGGQPVGMKDGS